MSVVPLRLVIDAHRPILFVSTVGSGSDHPPSKFMSVCARSIYEAYNADHGHDVSFLSVPVANTIQRAQRMLVPLAL